MNKIVSVWLTLSDGKNKGKIALQKRSLKDSFPYVCQATWAGKVELGENTMAAIFRECKEELGEEFFKNFDFSKLKLFCKCNFVMKKGKWQANNYIGKISQALLEKVKIHDEALKEFIFVGNSDAVYSIKSEKNPKDTTVLFDNDYEVFNKILNGN